MEKKQACTQCGACFNTCPTFQRFKSEEFSPKAKQLLLATALEPHGEDILQWKKMIHLAGHCTSCERCKNACPIKLSVPKVLAEARAKHPKWQQYAWREWIQHSAVLWPPAKHMAPLIPQKILPSKLAILHASALAMQEPPTIQAWALLTDEGQKEQNSKQNNELYGKNVAIFAGCTAQNLRPQWIEKSKKMLTKLGANVLENINFNCCGGTYEHAGLPSAAKKTAKHNIETWEKAGRPILILFCASCTHSLRHYTFASTEQKEAFVASLQPLATLLQTDCIKVTHEAPKTIHYHSPCHWEGKDMDLFMLRKIFPQLQQGKALCCGFGGVLKMLNPTLSEDLAEICWQGFSSTENAATYVISGCSGCIMQLSAHAPKNTFVYHWLDILQ